MEWMGFPEYPAATWLWDGVDDDQVTASVFESADDPLAIVDWYKDTLGDTAQMEAQLTTAGLTSTVFSFVMTDSGARISMWPIELYRSQAPTGLEVKLGETQTVIFVELPRP